MGSVLTPLLRLSRRRILAMVTFSLISSTLGGLATGRAPSRHLYINTAFGPPVAGREGFFDRLMQLVFDRLGYAVTVQAPPAERALMLANAGVDDGDGPRIPGLMQDYSNLIHVPEPVIDIEFVAFTKRLRFETNSWQSLAPFSVATVTGWKILERNITAHSGLVRVKDPEHLFVLLKQGRTEVAVIDRFSGCVMARKIGLRDFNVLAPPLASTPMYLYLHKRHADLIPAVTAALRDLKASGLYERLLQETVKDVYPDALVSNG